jgi:hypothetical protein
VNNKLERSGGKWPQPNLQYCPIIYLDGMKKSTKVSIKMVGVLAKIQVGNLLNTSEKCYCLKQLIQSRDFNNGLYVNSI